MSEREIFTPSVPETQSNSPVLDSLSILGCPKTFGTNYDTATFRPGESNLTADDDKSDNNNQSAGIFDC